MKEGIPLRPDRFAYGVRRLIVHAAALLTLFVTLPAHAADRLVVAFGDSLMAGYQLKPGEGFAPRLEAALRKSGVAAHVHNAGVSGDTTAQGKARLGWVLGALKARPDLVIVELGANDMLRGLPNAQTRLNLDAILTDLKRRKVPVLIAGMRAAPNMGPAYTKEFNAIYPTLARKHGLPLYPFFMEGVAANRALLLKDGMHPNPRGVDVIVRGILPQVRKALAQ
ncbi:acyl-CoA thioesterase-1 [Sphingomonas laterariae]|uniref:Acyl-CoA thioesterase-1 n=2 Tax=Edaphosphingomonas laterariae TaxID=861865 RepID=A0A239EFC3_9SPHN|nr:acyl-CoA thioesterase-1 [Sphingomonas laterariae]